MPTEDNNNAVAGLTYPTTPAEAREINEANRGYQLIVAKENRRVGGDRAVHAFAVVVNPATIHLLDGRGLTAEERYTAATKFLDDFYPGCKIFLGAKNIYYSDWKTEK